LLKISGNIHFERRLKVVFELMEGFSCIFCGLQTAESNFLQLKYPKNLQKQKKNQNQNNKSKLCPTKVTEALSQKPHLNVSLSTLEEFWLSILYIRAKAEAVRERKKDFSVKKRPSLSHML
jgi:hypothetical protein